MKAWGGRNEFFVLPAHMPTVFIHCYPDRGKPKFFCKRLCDDGLKCKGDQELSCVAGCLEKFSEVQGILENYQETCGCEAGSMGVERVRCDMIMHACNLAASGCCCSGRTMTRRTTLASLRFLACVLLPAVDV